MRSRIRARFASRRRARPFAVHPRPYPRCLADQLRFYDITVNCIAPRHRNPITAWFRVATRCLRLPRALIPRHSDSPTFAQFQANREGALFGPGLILFREDLYILSGNLRSLEPRSYGFATKTSGGRGNIMKACGRASLRFQKPGYLSIQAIFASAHFVRVNNGGGLAWTKPIVGSA